MDRRTVFAALAVAAVIVYAVDVASRHRASGVVGKMLAEHPPAAWRSSVIEEARRITETAADGKG